VLEAHGIVMSMSRPGNCWDNAVAESFFSTLKIELAHEADWGTQADAYRAVFEYLEVFYNGSGGILLSATSAPLRSNANTRRS
jgi:putative transposase